MTDIDRCQVSEEVPVDNQSPHPNFDLRERPGTLTDTSAVTVEQKRLSYSRDSRSCCDVICGQHKCEGYECEGRGDEDNTC